MKRKRGNVGLRNRSGRLSYGWSEKPAKIANMGVGEKSVRIRNLSAGLKASKISNLCAGEESVHI